MSKPDIDLTVQIGSLILPNPVLVASGTFSNGEEMIEFVDLSRLGGIVMKGTTLHPRTGNPYSRVVETPSGLLNSIGLQNVGLEETLAEKAPFIKQHGIPAIINISGESSEEYAEMARRIDDCPAVDAIEMNVSCPNVKHGGIAFGTDERILADAVGKTRAATRKPLIVKLSPNVTDITAMARAVEDAGADAVSLINTLVGMVIDTRTRMPVLANKIGGLSGPAIRPVAVRMTWQVAGAVSIPVIGMGGIEKLDDALQFFIAGAAAIQVGTANFYNPTISVDLVDELTHYLKEHNLGSPALLRGPF
jgi:dihydroorotate dehydrogenase (NAD+) catalytic subunit